MKTYWIAFCNDGVPLFEVERTTRSEAIKDLKEAYRLDSDESPDGAAYNDYYIEKFTETESELYRHGPEYFKMSRGPRGGVRAERMTVI